MCIYFENKKLDENLVMEIIKVGVHTYSFSFTLSKFELLVLGAVVASMKMVLNNTFPSSL